MIVTCTIIQGHLLIFFFFNSEVNRTEEALQSDIFVVGLKRSEEI